MELSSVVGAYQTSLQTSGQPPGKWARFGEIFSSFWWIIVLLLVFVWYMYSFANNASRGRKMYGG